jgi:RHS repeat-associated protein
MTHYLYDAAGNPAGIGDSTAWGNRLVKHNGYQYEFDADGNVTRRYTTGFDQRLFWNSINQLDSVTTNGTTTLRFYYDGLDRRILRDGLSVKTVYVYDGPQVFAELDGTYAVTAVYKYLPGLDKPASVSTATGVRYFVRDAMGNVTGVVRSGGVSLAEYEYSPFGEITVKRADVPNDVRFKSRILDSETGLYENRARFYDPKAKRFLSEDPTGVAGGLNPYLYGGNDPINMADPLGLCTYVVVTYEGDNIRNISHRYAPIGMTIYDDLLGGMYTCGCDHEWIPGQIDVPCPNDDEHYTVKTGPWAGVELGAVGRHVTEKTKVLGIFECITMGAGATIGGAILLSESKMASAVVETALERGATVPYHLPTDLDGPASFGKDLWRKVSKSPLTVGTGLALIGVVGWCHYNAASAQTGTTKLMVAP